MTIFSQATNARTWADAARLCSELSKLSNKALGGYRDFRMTVWGDGKVWITMEIGSSKYIGKGSTPWEAADDLAVQSAALAKKIENLL